MHQPTGARTKPLSLPVNNAGVAHYKPMAELSVPEARELRHVKIVAPTVLTLATMGGMTARGAGAIGQHRRNAGLRPPGPGRSRTQPARRLRRNARRHSHHDPDPARRTARHGRLRARDLPGIVATDFHEVQGMDLAALAE